jgi:hypothetical protein
MDGPRVRPQNSAALESARQFSPSGARRERNFHPSYLTVGDREHESIRADAIRADGRGAFES